MKTRQDTRKQEEDHEAVERARKLLKRSETLFTRKDNVIRRNDLITDPVARKIKLEPEENASPVVKQEAEELLQEVESDVEMLEEEVASNVTTGEQATTSAAVTAPPPTVSTSTSAQCRAVLLQIRNEALEIESEKLKTLLVRKDAEIGMLLNKISQLEGNLVQETGNSDGLRLEMEKMKQVLMEKELEIRQLKEALAPPTQTIQDEEATMTTAPLVLTPKDKVSQLFPDVLKIIIRNEARIGDHCVHWRKLLPLLTPCRKVCKFWKHSVDLIMQQDSTHLDITRIERRWPYCREDYMPFPIQLSYPEFDDAQWTAKLKFISGNLQENPGYNPIPSRHLVILTGSLVDYSSERWTNFCKTVKRFLELIGHQVWYLTVDYEGERFSYRHTLQDCVVAYRILSEWFSLVPKLRSLSLTTLTKAHDNWRHELEKIPFPGLKYLETLMFPCVQDTHLNFVILENNCHVKKLQLCPKPTPYPYLPVSMGIHLPNLSKIVCKFFSVDDWNQFTSLATWKLEDLSVEFYSNGRPNAAQFVKGVARFRNTLRSLTFKLAQIGKGPVGERLRLNLPRLKRLQLHIGNWEHVKLEQLLVSLESLETFSVQLSVQHRIYLPCKGNKTTFLDFVNNFPDKVDWRKVAKLRNVNLTVRINHAESGKRDLFVVRRENMHSVRFSVVKISAAQIMLGGLVWS